MEKVVAPIEIYTEMTPNPAGLKFVTNRMLLQNNSVDFREVREASKSPFATGLFTFPFVHGVFISNNFVTVTKDMQHEWHDIIPQIKHFIKDWLNEENEIVEEGALLNPTEAGEENTEVEAQIIELLNNYVRPAVENDGGAIQFKSYKDGVVNLVMQGACSGCPSSTITLKAGIEGLLKRMVPEVQEVVAEEG